MSDWSVLLGYRGSVSHGTYRPNNDPNSIDDVDLMGICVPPIDYYFGTKQFGSRGTQEIVDNEWDIVVYEAKKMIHLLAQGNPNVLSMLWMEPEFYIDITPAGQLLIDSRHLFSAAHVYRSFTSYAHSQLKKMESFVFNGYMGEKRKQLTLKYGYDTKNASHLIRLLRMGVEFLETGELVVLRPDASELLAIKDGNWSLDKIKSTADELFTQAERAYLNTHLPDKPDMDNINQLSINVIKTHYQL